MIRDATAEDAAACAAVYAPYVAETAITFELDAPDAAEFARRIAAAHCWLVAEEAGEVVGYAYGGVLKARAAYRYACETTIYLRPGLRRSGTGRALMEALLPRLQALGMRHVVACIALPNEASIGLHRALGFEDAGIWRRVGWKLGRWWDIAYLQRTLPGPDPSVS